MDVLYPTVVYEAGKIQQLEECLCLLHVSDHVMRRRTNHNDVLDGDAREHRVIQ
jgi:hypothetical protein